MPTYREAIEFLETQGYILRNSKWVPPPEHTPTELELEMVNYLNKEQNT